MKRLNKRASIFTALLCTALLFLSACENVGGYNNAPWINKAPAPQAEHAPQGLPDGIYREGYQDYKAKTGEAGVTQSQPQYSMDGLYNTQNRPQMDSVKVALLLPLSGNHARLGQSMLNAAQMALFDVGHSNFELLPQDTLGTGQGARTAAQNAIKQGAQLIIGPLFSDAVQGVKTVASSANINVIAFSTDWRLADKRTFLMGFLPFDQVSRIAVHAQSQGVRNVGALIPDTAYGNTVISSFQKAASGAGLNLIDIRKLNPHEKNLSPAVKEFARYDARANGTQPPPFDAVFMPVGGNMARTLGSLTYQYKVGTRDLMLIGTGVWDDAALARDPALNGARFAGPSPALRRSFEGRYTALYNESPERLATLAYDATALAAILAQTGLQTTGTPAFDARSIANPNGFAGVDGIFRFFNNGIVERGLSVLSFKNGQIVIIEDAPQSFQ